MDLILSSEFIWVVSKRMSFLTFAVLKVHCGKEAFYWGIQDQLRRLFRSSRQEWIPSWCRVVMADSKVDRLVRCRVFGKT